MVSRLSFHQRSRGNRMLKQLMRPSQSWAITGVARVDFFRRRKRLASSDSIRIRKSPIQNSQCNNWTSSMIFLNTSPLRQHPLSKTRYSKFRTICNQTNCRTPSARRHLPCRGFLITAWNTRSTEKPRIPPWPRTRSTTAFNSQPQSQTILSVPATETCTFNNFYLIICLKKRGLKMDGKVIIYHL